MVVPEKTTGPHSDGSAHRGREVFPWKVVHACEQARDVLMLVEAELAVGMRPFLVTPRGFGAASTYLSKPPKEQAPQISLLQAWGHVRNWKRLLNQSNPDGSAEVLHAHSFSAGMAAVRSDAAAVVYDLSRPVEQIAVQSGQSWLGRSFRAAEQFVLSHAGAVVVHEERLLRECLERGVEKRNLFLVPYPIDSALFESVPSRQWIQQRIGATAQSVIFLVPLAVDPAEAEDSISILMSAFSLALGEFEPIKLVFVADKNPEAILRQAEGHNLRRIMHVLPQGERDQAIASCDVVIALKEGCTPPGSDGKQPDLILEAIARGRTVLAAESDDRQAPLPARSCVWFHADDPRQLGQRASFLARNPDFCRVLSATARQHLSRTRGFSAIGALYDEVYAHASANRKSRNGGHSEPQLVPLPMPL